LPGSWPSLPAPEPTAERIGVLGGTFDPVHVGHLVAAVNVRHALQLDRVLLVVANQPWQKVGTRAVSPAADRLALVEAAVGDVVGVEASSLEVDRGGVSYTADTVAELAVLHPGAQLFVVVGEDVAAGLSSWERIDEIRDQVTLVVVTRPGDFERATAGLEGWRTVAVEIPALEISSTDLRDRAATGRPLDYLVPPDPPAQVVRCGQMTEPVASRTERRRRRERRRAGILGLGILLSSIAATVALLLFGSVGARGAVSHPPTTPHRAATTAGAR
jgi:nicotinate-nucleotide adenylyltransferase